MEEIKMSIYAKLANIQNELKAPKSQYNNFGKYKYRNCEDILEAVKPLLIKYGTSLTISDSIEMIADRIYVKATAVLFDTEGVGSIQTQAYAREENEKKGMDASQVTGATSSYARKYCLNGLFAIDDTKDADTTNTHGQEEKPQKFTMQVVNKAEKVNSSELVNSVEKSLEEKPKVEQKVLSKEKKTRADAIKEAQSLTSDDLLPAKLQAAMELGIDLDKLKMFFGVKYLSNDLLDIAIAMKGAKK